MTFDELTLHNFGSYRGRQKIALTPADPNRPIILIGGLNGSGKTTLLDALQLVLYGKHARRSSNEALAYEEFLRRTVHRGVPPEDGAALELTFHRVSNSRENQYVVHRSWAGVGTTTRERLEIWRDGVLDRALTELWAEHVEALVPVSVSQLFLFDGEKIETLADIESSRAVLREGINALLGLDLVDQLTADLALLERRKRHALVSDEKTESVKEEATEQKLVELREGVYQRLGAANNRRRELESQLKRVEERFRRAGGSALEQNGDLVAKREAIERRSDELTHELLRLASGAAPLSLVRPLLEDALIRGTRETETARSRALLTLIAERDAMIIARLRAFGIPEKTITSLGEFLSRDRAKRDTPEATEVYVGLSEEACRAIDTVLRGELPVELTESEQLLTELEVLDGQATQVDRQLEATPEPATLKEVSEERDTIRRLVAETTGHIQALEAEWQRLDKEIDVRAREALERARAAETANRVLVYSARVRETLRRFRAEKLSLHLDRLGGLITDGFQMLLHKERLVSRVQIDPETFTLQLAGPGGGGIPAEHLSAGERQLLAISILWGLARATGRRLPVVIDTPLGRLDSVHRAHIVERYFPNASHQVILLSTDEEIVGEYASRIAPWVGRRYRLDFDDLTNRTTIQSGYLAEGIASATSN